MKHLLLALTVAFMACNGKEEEKVFKTGPNYTTYKTLIDSTWEENGDLVYRARNARSPEDTIHLGKFNWDAFEIDQHGCLRVINYASPEEIKIAWDSAVKIQKKNPRPKLNGTYIRYK